MFFKMSDVNSQNLNAHYTSNTKVKKPLIRVAVPPSGMIKNNYAFNDAEATKRISYVRKSVDNDLKKEKNRDFRFFLKILTGVALFVITILGLKNFFKKS